MSQNIRASLVAQTYNAGDLGLIPGWGRSCGEGNGPPLQYSCLENPMDGGAWQATVHGVAKSWTRLSDFTFISGHVVSVFCHLTYSTQHNTFKVHPGCLKWQDFILFMAEQQFTVFLLHHLYPFIHQCKLYVVFLSQQL